MKELSIEEKAKAYDEALEKAKMVLQERGNEPDGASMLSALFPELTESEDEKIRKVLLNDFKNHCSEYYCESVNRDMVIAWLEKQGEHAKFRDSIQVGDKVTRNQDGVLVNLSQLKRVAKKDEKQGKQKPIDPDTLIQQRVDALADIVAEQKPTNKVKPKFKVSDWIINRTDATIMQIVNNKDFYESVEIGGQRRTDTYNYIEWDFRLWTIQDAKDGDVLACPNDAGDRDVVFIFKNINSDVGWVFCFCASDANGCFCTNNDYVGNSNSTNISPATKEQRDLLFQKMKEAGYEWDAEKKELKKIEQKFAEWSEEDENRFNNLIFLVECSDENEPTKKGFIDFINRLKSIIHQKQ